jgi:hypothetical protein
MKISPRATALAYTTVALLAISACGSSDSNSGATPRTKNAAIQDANGNWVQVTPTKLTTTTVGAKVTTTTVCVVELTNAQSATAIIEAQLISEGIATATAQSAAAAAAGNIERAGLLTKDNCAPSVTTLPPTLAPTTLAPKATLAPKTTTPVPAGCNPALWLKTGKCYK